MKRTKITFLVASLLCLGMGVGGALALTYTGASRSVNGAVDEAIYLYWGTGQSSVDIQDVTDLVKSVNQYRYFACEPSASASVAGTVTLTYEIKGTTDGENKTYTLDGLQVKIYETPSLQSDENRDLTGLVPTVLNYDVEADRTKTTSFLVGGENAGAAYYCLEFVYDGSEATGDAWGGLMTISQAFAAAQEGRI